MTVRRARDSGQLLYGFHAITARLRHDAATVEHVFHETGRDDQRMRHFLQTAATAGVRLTPADTRRLHALAGHDRHQGVVACVTTPPQRTLPELLDCITDSALFLVLDGVTDPHNLGACLRVANAAGVQAVIAPRDRACGLNATVAHAASGAAETTPYFPVTNLARTLRMLKEAGMLIVGSADDAKNSLFDATLTDPLALVMGAESAGMRRLTRAACDQVIRIPMWGHVTSLNVSVASAISLFEVRRQRLALP
jgi:23S rRNA (guanosine2251-2'-O)-methyltransferase